MSAACPGGPMMQPVGTPPVRSLSVGRVSGLGSLSSGRLSPGPTRQGSAPAARCMPGGPPLRQPIGWASMPQVPAQGKAVPMRMNSASSVGCEGLAAWSPPPGSPVVSGGGSVGAQFQIGRQFSIPTGLPLGSARAEAHAEHMNESHSLRFGPPDVTQPMNENQHSSYIPLPSNVSCMPTSQAYTVPTSQPRCSPVARCRERSASPSHVAGWQFSGQSPQEGWQFSGQMPSVPAQVPFTPQLHASPREIEGVPMFPMALGSAREESIHTHRSTGSAGPHRNNCTVMVEARPLHTQQSNPSSQASIYPPNVPCYDIATARSVQSVHSDMPACACAVPARSTHSVPVQDSTQTSFAQPLQPQQNPPACVTSPGMLPTVAALERSQVPEPLVEACVERVGTDGQLSPRDTVWKRYFSDQLGQQTANMEAQPAEQQAAYPSAGGRQTPAAVCGSMPHPGVPRLPLQSAAVQVCHSEGALGLPQAALQNTARNNLPATERSNTSRAGPSRFPPHVLAAGIPTLPAVPQQGPSISRASSHECVRLTTGEADPHPERVHLAASEGATFALPPWRTSVWQGPSAPTGSAEIDVCEPNASAKNAAGSALQHAMGQFGAPDPPVAIDMAPLLSQRAPALSPSFSARSGPCDQSPAEYTPQSFIVSTSPAQQCQNETFLQTNGLWPNSQAGSDYTQQQKVEVAASTSIQKLIAEVPTPLRSHSTFVSHESAPVCAEPSQLRQPTQLRQNSLVTASDGAENAQPSQPRVRGMPGSAVQAGEQDARAAPGDHCRQQLQQPALAPMPETTEAEELVAEAASAVTLRDLAELRSFRNPPVLVCQVLEPLAVLLGVSDTRWPKMRKLLDGNLLGRLFSFEPSQLTQAQVDRVEALLQAPAFADGGLHEKCPAAVALASWCDAILFLMKDRSHPKGHDAKRDVDAPSNVTTCRPELGGLTVEPNLWALSETELSRVRGLRFTREGVGSIRFHGETDVRDVLPHLADVVLLQPGEVVVYPNPGTKPPVGVGLNKAADITLVGCMPKTQGFRDEKGKERYRRRVKQMTEDKGADFVDYDCTVGTWKFRVNHF